MARIYNRDNINYSGLISQAIQNANQTSQLYANKWQPGSTIGQAIGQAGDKLQQAGWNEWSAQQNDARAKAMQQRQFEQQDKLQKAQEELQRENAEKNFERQLILNDINAKNARELARIQKETQAEYNRDEWMKQYELSGIDYDFAKAAYAKDPSQENLMRLRRAEANVLHWANKSGANIYNPAKDLPSEQEVEGIKRYDSADEARKVFNSILGSGNDPITNEQKSEALDVIKSVSEENKALRDELTNILEQRGATVEERKEAYQTSYNKAVDKWLKNPMDYNAKKGWKSKQSGNELILYDPNGDIAARQPIKGSKSNNLGSTGWEL